MADPTAEQFVAALRRVEEDGDVEALAALFAEDARITRPSHLAHADRQHVGSARAFWSQYRKSFARVRSHFHAVLESDARAMLEWTSECRTAAGIDTKYDGVSVFETRDGKIVRFAAYFDPAALAARPAGDGRAEPAQPTATAGARG